MVHKWSALREKWAHSEEGLGAAHLLSSICLCKSQLWKSHCVAYFLLKTSSNTFNKKPIPFICMLLLPQQPRLLLSMKPWSLGPLQLSAGNAVLPDPIAKGSCLQWGDSQTSRRRLVSSKATIENRGFKRPGGRTIQRLEHSDSPQQRVRMLEGEGSQTACHKMPLCCLWPWRRYLASAHLNFFISIIV